MNKSEPEARGPEDDDRITLYSVVSFSCLPTG
jgi:hypothetical protein